MGTMGFVGTVDEQGTLTGRPVCTDGYPSGLGRQLVNILASFDGGLDQMLAVIESRNVWGTVYADASAELDPHYGSQDGFEMVAGVGRAHVNGRDDFEDPEFGTLGVDNGEYAWGYWFTTREVSTAELVVTEGTEEVARIPAHELVGYTEREAWTAIECGERYERCSHYAWFHFPEIEHSVRLGTQKYLGLEPLDARDAVGGIYLGVEYTFTGSGFAGGYEGFGGRKYPGRKGLWYMIGRDAAGNEVNVPAFVAKSGNPIKTTTLIYPEIRTSQEAGA
jgi:hypothetical protein